MVLSLELKSCRILWLEDVVWAEVSAVPLGEVACLAGTEACLTKKSSTAKAKDLT